MHQRYHHSYSECKLHGQTLGGSSLLLHSCFALQIELTVILYVKFPLYAKFVCHFLQNYYPILFRGVNGTVAHEFIVDLRGFKVYS